MKAPSFAYARARSLPEAFQLMETYGGGAKLLAGGQSLLATLNLRLSAPAALIDLTGIAQLSGIRMAGGKAHIGALTTHAEIEQSPEVAARLPLLSQAAPHIAHVAIRNAGTLGGSLALADPAAEWPACCLALDAEIVIASKTGERRVPARDFFKGTYATDLRPGEVLTGVEFPLSGPARRAVFMELAPRRGDYATVGIAAVAEHARGTLSAVRLAYLGSGEKPLLATRTMAAVEGRRAGAEASAAAVAALDGELEPVADLYHTAATKLHLARVLTGRALAALAA